MPFFSCVSSIFLYGIYSLHKKSISKIISSHVGMNISHSPLLVKPSIAFQHKAMMHDVNSISVIDEIISSVMFDFLLTAYWANIIQAILVPGSRLRKAELSCQTRSKLSFLDAICVTTQFLCQLLSCCYPSLLLRCASGTRLAYTVTTYSSDHICNA